MNKYMRLVLMVHDYVNNVNVNNKFIKRTCTV